MASIPAPVRTAANVAVLFVVGLCYVFLLTLGTTYRVLRRRLGRVRSLGRAVGARVRRRRGESTPRSR